MIGNPRLPRQLSSMIGFGKTLGLLSFAALPALRAQSPEISRISPMAARPGETVTVTLQGKNLLQPQQLWTSFGAKTEWEAQAPGRDGKISKREEKELVGKLTMAPDAPLGLGFLRLPTATGLSGPLFFLVDELPVVTKNPQNASAEKAQAVTAPAAVEGAAEVGRSDFYRVEMKAAESISVEAFAGRIGSKMDPVLRLLDAEGKELAFVDDTLGLAGDCRLRYRATADGPLMIELRDASFTGGPEYFYHLRIGDFPLVSGVFPPVAAPGETVEVQATGEAVEGVALFRVTAQKCATGIESAPVRFGPGKPAAFAYVRTDDLPVYLEKEPSDTPETALAVAAPCMVLGRIHKPGERNVFLIATKKDDRMTLTPLTRDIGSPAILYIGVDDEKGDFIASNDTPGNTPTNATSNDMALTFRAPADGVCRISVEDIAHRGGDEFVYGIHIERSTQGFDLTASADRFVAPRGGSFSAKVTAQRRGVNGPITLELVSGDALPLPSGFHCEQNIIEKGKNDTQLKVTAPADVPSGTLYHVRIVGHAMEGGVQFDAAAAPAKTDSKKAPKDPAMAALGSMPQPPRLLCETFPICVGPDAPDFFSIELTAGGVDLPTIVGKSSFILRQKSIDPAYAGDARLKFDGLPPGVAITSGPGRGGRIAGQVDFICEVTGPADIAPGVHAFDIVASGELKGAQKEVRLAKVPLRVVMPLGIAGAVTSPIAPGEKQKLKITAARYDTEDPQPIDVTLLHFPSGITGPEKVTIAPGDTEAVVELAAETGAPEGKFDTVVLGAATRVKGVDVAVESSPIHLEVRK
jgi:hypothetical protein